MKQILYILFIVLMLMGFYSCVLKMELVFLDGYIKVVFIVDIDGKMMYWVIVNDIFLLDNFLFGFEVKDGIDFNWGFCVVNIVFIDKDEIWMQFWGENKMNWNYYNEMVVFLKNVVNVELIFCFCVFDDGVVFCYEYEVFGVDFLLIIDELIVFCFYEDGIFWFIFVSFEIYELLYLKQKISEVENVNIFFIFKIFGGVYGSIYEVVFYDFLEMILKKDGENILKFEFVLWFDGIKVCKENCFIIVWCIIQIVL